MPKKNLLISAALTAFILVIVTGVASAYKQASTVLASIQSQPTAVAAAPVDVVMSPAEVSPVMLTHQEAALVAANYLGQTDLYSVESTMWNGVDAYKVVFSSGNVVYVSVFGEVLGTEAPQTVVVANNNGASNNSPRLQQTSRENHEDHEDHDSD